MKQKLLIAALALSCTMGTHAYEEGAKVFTSSARYLVTGPNQFINGDFATGNVEGWLNSDGETPVDDTAWGVVPSAGPEAENVVSSLGATEGASMSQVIKLESAGSYIVSYAIRAAGEETVSGTTSVGTTVSNNYLDIFLNTDGARVKVASADGAQVADIAAAQAFDAEWKTVNYYFEVSDSTNAPMYLVVNMERMATGIQITNFSVNTVDQIYDIRTAQRLVDYARELANDPNFNVDAAADARQLMLEQYLDVFDEMAATDALDDTEAGSSFEAELASALAAYLDVTSLNVNALMPGVDVQDVINAGSVGRGNTAWFQKYMPGLKLEGNWGHAPGDAPYLMSAIQTGYDHTATYTAYNTNFPAGKYFFTCEVRNATTNRTSWPCVLTFNAETTCELFVGDNRKDVGPVAGEQFQRFYMIADVSSDGTFEAGIYWPGVGGGGAFQIQNVEVRSFNLDIVERTEHVKAWQFYQAQWEAATNAHNNMHKLMGDKSYPWSQGVLSEAATALDPIYQAQADKNWNNIDAASTEEFNEWALYQGFDEYETNEETGEERRMEYQLVRRYNNASNAVIADNKPISDLKAAIADAEDTLNDPKYLAGKRVVFKQAINEVLIKLNGLLSSTTDESREADLATIDELQQELAEAKEDFINSVDVAPFIDIDFSNAASQNNEGLYEIAGTDGKGTMVFSSFSEDNNLEESSPFALGVGEEYLDVLRVGNGTATVNFDAPEDTDIMEFNFDLWVGNLSGCNVWVQLKNANGDRIAGFSINRYNGTVAYNDFNDTTGAGGAGLDLLNYVSGIGSSSQQDGAIKNDNTNRSSFTLKVNYAAGIVSGKINNSKNGICAGADMPLTTEFEDNKIVAFELGSNYTQRFPARRCWFDNLQITQYPGAAGVIGDVNGDGAVNVADISAIIDTMAEGATSKAADVNGDGSVNVADISAVIDIMAGN